MIPPCLTLSNVRHVSRVKWSNPGKGVAPSPTPWCSSYWKGNHMVTLDYGRQLYFSIIIVLRVSIMKPNASSILSILPLLAKCFGEIYIQMLGWDFWHLLLWWIVRINDFVYKFIRKPFWFFLWIFLTSDWIWLKSRVFQT